MDKMEISTTAWIEFIIEKGKDEVEADKKKEVANFMEALNALKLSTVNFATRSGMQTSGKKKAGGDKPDIQSVVEASLAEEVFECWQEIMSEFIKDRMKEISMKDTRVEKTIDLIQGMLVELHGKNLEVLEKLETKRSVRSRKLKKNADLRKEVEDKQKSDEPEPEPEATGGGPPGPPGGGGRGGLLRDAAGRGRGGLMGAIQAGRGRGGSGRGGLLNFLKEAADAGGGGGGRGGLLDAIKTGRGAGRGPPGGGRGGLMAAIAARGGGGD